MITFHLLLPVTISNIPGSVESSEKSRDPIYEESSLQQAPPGVKAPHQVLPELAANVPQPYGYLQRGTENLEDASLVFHLKPFQLHPSGPLLQVVCVLRSMPNPSLKALRGFAELSHLSNTAPLDTK